MSQYYACECVTAHHDGVIIQYEGVTTSREPLGEAAGLRRQVGGAGGRDGGVLDMDRTQQGIVEGVSGRDFEELDHHVQPRRHAAPNNRTQNTVCGSVSVHSKEWLSVSVSRASVADIMKSWITT